MTLFVGGPLHGTEVDVLCAPNGALPPSYVDVGSGTTYGRSQVSWVIPHPITQLPDRQVTATVYLHPDLGADPNAAMGAMQDAVTRWWFITTGTTSSLTAPSTPDGPAAGPNMLYLAGCKDCAVHEGKGEEVQRVFPDVGTRAKWMFQHNLDTGHAPTYRDVNIDQPEEQ